MDEEEKASYRKAGDIAKDVREWSRGLVKPDAKVFDVAGQIESRIKESGGEMAFPVNICINDITAHYTPRAGDETKIRERDVVTIDLGVHINGCIADTAYTMDLSGDYSGMLRANEEALSSVIESIKPGISTGDLGEVVQSTLEDAGYKPIENLTGHEVKQYNLHAGISIPNVPVSYEKEIEEGMVLAIEPFATDGAGRVIESKQAEIFSLEELRPVRMRDARIMLNEIEKTRKALPFAARWFSKKISPLRLNILLRDLTSQGILHKYPILHEKEGGVVSQFEHTLIVTEDGCEVTT